MVSSTFSVERVIGCRCTDNSSLGNRWTYLWMVFPILGMRISSPASTQESTGLQPSLPDVPANPALRATKGNGRIPLQKGRLFPPLSVGPEDSKPRDQEQAYC